MSIDGVDGYLTAWLVGPSRWLAEAPTADWLPAIWGGDDAGGHEVAAPFASKRQRKATVVQLLRHLRHLDDVLQRRPDAWEPIFGVAEQGADEWVDASDWCAGFLQAVDLDPDAWAPVWQDAALADALMPLVQLGGGLDAAQAAPDVPDDAQAVDALSRAVPEGVLLLAARRGDRDGAAPLQ